jgi:hypothetical protein
MKPPLTFFCALCRKPIGVALEHAGKAVTCPHCRQAVTAPPAPAVVAAVPQLPPQVPSASVGLAEQHARNFAAKRQEVQEREDSIFGDAIEEDDEALFGLGSAKKAPAVDMPETATAVDRNTPLKLSQPTQRVPGLAPPPMLPRPQLGSQPVIKIPLAEADAEPFPATASTFAAPNGYHADANPFEMEAAIPTEFSEPSAAPSVSSRRKKEAEPGDGPNWKLWIMIGLAGYSFLITIVAVWGWMRSPAAPPVKTDSHTPATQKAKMR